MKKKPSESTTSLQVEEEKKEDGLATSKRSLNPLEESIIHE
jgi:hypothetical protein